MWLTWLFAKHQCQLLTNPKCQFDELASHPPFWHLRRLLTEFISGIYLCRHLDTLLKKTLQSSSAWNFVGPGTFLKMQFIPQVAALLDSKLASYLFFFMCFFLRHPGNPNRIIIRHIGMITCHFGNPWNRKWLHNSFHHIITHSLIYLSPSVK